jgi:hypothetical protein
VPNFVTHTPVTILSRQQIRQFYERSPDEMTTIYTFHLSNIAYNATRDKALFVSSFFCQDNFSRADVIILQRVDNRWQLIDSFQLWIT